MSAIFYVMRNIRTNKNYRQQQQGEHTKIYPAVAWWWIWSTIMDTHTYWRLSDDLVVGQLAPHFSTAFLASEISLCYRVYGAVMMIRAIANI